MLAAIVLAVIVSVASGVPAGGQAVDRAWQTGTWVSGTVAARGRGGVVGYVIDADDARYDVQETAPPGAPPPRITAGAPVVFAVDKDVFYIRGEGNSERQLRLVKTTRKLKTYSAAGPGHFIRAIGDGGRTITLEDGSVWNVDPRTQFKTVEWESLAGITVHVTAEDPDFNYILNNTDEDDWTFVTLVTSP